MMCDYCKNHKSIRLSKCAGGALKGSRIEAVVLDEGIIFMVNNIAAGYFDAKFCFNCGEPLTESEPPKEE